MAARAVTKGGTLERVKPVAEVCLELEDHGQGAWLASTFFGMKPGRDVAAPAARLAEQFAAMNERLLERMDVGIVREYDGSDVVIRLRAGSMVGALALLSPTNARPDYGLVIQPRFPWSGIGPMMAQTGWRVVPQPMKLPLLRRSERRVPSWVLSAMVLGRLKAMVEQLDRRFELVEEVRSVPRGRVDWGAYATRFVAQGKPDQVPCRFADLRHDKELKGAIRYAVERHIGSLEGQLHHGIFARQLLEVAEQLLRRLSDVVAVRPAEAAMQGWMSRPFRNVALIEGLEGIAWTRDERGLAGVSDLEGVPWRMAMEEFFEAWVEVLLERVAPQTGGRLRVGRRKETTTPIRWDEAYLGTQKALVPDLMMEFAGTCLIVDAKYKRHWEELRAEGWGGMGEAAMEAHRQDLLQVLAYANLSGSERVVVCLVYPCEAAAWKQMRAEKRLWSRGELGGTGRTVEVWLTAVAMDGELGTVTEEWVERVKAAEMDWGGGVSGGR